MTPVLRPLDCGEPVPDGWSVEPIGQWHGNDTEVAYDPRRYDVALARDGVIDDLEDRLVAGGWEYSGTDGRSSLWVRDRVAAARQQAARPLGPPGRDLGGLGR